MSHLIFCFKNEISFYFHKDFTSQVTSFNLLDVSYDFFKLLPRNFIISTNNGSYKFNSDMLKDTSSVISTHLRDNPQNLQYHIDIDDEKHVMEKIEQMYQGKEVTFFNSDLFFIQKLSEILNISSFPDCMLPYNLRSQLSPMNIMVQKTYQVLLKTSSLINFLTNNFQRPFTILVNHKEYKCNYIAVQTSNLIKEKLQEDPELDCYEYKVEDEYDDFEVICKLFNFQLIQITTGNMNSLKQFAEDLQIDAIKEKIDSFISTYESAVQTIDDKHLLIDTIDQIFDLLYNTDKLPLEHIKDSIINSIWSQTEENVSELAACFLQVVEANRIYQSNLLDLLLLIDESCEENNHLKSLIPIIINNLMIYFGSSLMNCAFIYKLHQKGFIKKEEIIEKMKPIFTHLNSKPHSLSIPIMNDRIQNIRIGNIALFFLPEFVEIHNGNIENQMNFLSPIERDFIRSYFPDRMEEYKQMREKGEPDDLITKVIINDDLDTMKDILSHKNDFATFDNKEIPFNIFESFIKNGATRYINYAAAYGSINCFKYFLLNHSQVDSFTLQYAVYGGNVEIIRIVDQIYNESGIKIQYYFMNKNDYHLQLPTPGSKLTALNPIIPAIKEHKNDLFDWILQEKYINNGFTDQLYDVFLLSSYHGNAHSLIECIDNGLNFELASPLVVSSSIRESAEHGFYRYLQLLFSLMEKVIKKEVIEINSSILFGNLSIFKLFLKYKFNNLTNFDDALKTAISCEHFNIVQYIVEELFKDDIKLSLSGIVRCLSLSIGIESPIFNYLINKFGFDRIIEKFKLESEILIRIVNDGCVASKFENVKIFTDLIFDRFPNSNFTSPFISATKSEALDICKYFIDKKVYINMFTLSEQAEELTSMDEQIFCLLFDKAEPEMKEIFLGNFLYKSLRSHNKKLAEYLLLKQDVPYENALFEAVMSHDLEIVKIVIKKDSSPSFINQVSALGTALNVSVFNKDIDIVKFLLSIPGIDPNLYEHSNYTPLITAIINFNMDIINVLLDFYGDKIEGQMWQLNVSLEIILEKILCNDEKDRQLNYLDHTIVHVVVKNENQKNYHQTVLGVIKRLLEIKNIDLNCHSKKHTLLTYACEIDDIDLVKMLIESNNVNVNSYAPKSGSTPLMIAIENKNLEIAKLLIESPKTNINLRNYKKETALTFAVKQQLHNIIKLLINNERFNAKESRLEYAFFISKGEISLYLLNECKDLDVNYRLYIETIEKISNHKNDFKFAIPLENDEQQANSGTFETSLIHSVIEKDIDKLKLIINHPSFNAVKSQVKTAIFTAVKYDQIEIFRELLPLVNNDVNISFQNGDSLLTYAVICKSDDIIAEIINNENFDSIQSDLLNAFVKTFSFDSNEYKKKNQYNNNQNNNPEERALFSSMVLMYEYDDEHEHLIDFSKLLPNGLSFFTSIFINCREIESVVEFLINHGVDPDCPDQRNVYPLEQAIKINSYQFARLLIETNRIDFNRLFSNGFNYLHLAANYKEERIFIHLMELNIIDVNLTDVKGDTPLLIATRNMNINIIQSLFLVDNLDYTHCNKKGEDAIKIAQDCAKNIRRRNHRISRNAVEPIQITGPIKTKGDYLSLLISILNVTK